MFVKGITIPVAHNIDPPIRKRSHFNLLQTNHFELHTSALLVWASKT